MVICGHSGHARVAGYRGTSKLIEGVIRIGDGISVRVGLGKDVSGKIVGRRKDRLLGGGRVLANRLANDVSGQIVFGARKGAFDVFGTNQAAERVVGVAHGPGKAEGGGFRIEFGHAHARKVIRIGHSVSGRDLFRDRIAGTGKVAHRVKLLGHVVHGVVGDRFLDKTLPGRVAVVEIDLCDRDHASERVV